MLIHRYHGNPLERAAIRMLEFGFDGVGTDQFWRKWDEWQENVQNDPAAALRQKEALARSCRPKVSGGQQVGSVCRFSVLLTTYDMVSKDPGPFQSIPWELVVIDEAQRLKNANSKLYKVLDGELHCKHRVLLTGTPIQNNMGELWALLHFVDGKSFANKERFLAKYGGQMDGAAVLELQNVLRHYLLRREKCDVAKSLPRKTEIIIDVELTVPQKQVRSPLL